MTLIIFICLSVLNVVLQTTNHIITVKGGKFSAALFNALTFGVYTVVLVYMSCDLPLWVKAVIVASCNLVGVFVVKTIEEKTKKDKLWKIEILIPVIYNENFENEISFFKIPYYNDCIDENYNRFVCFCYTQEDSEKVFNAASKFNCKTFVTENAI